MSKPYIHAQSSVKRFGGDLNDYLMIHDFMDSSKSVIADNRHRALFHTSFGCFIVEKVFGTVIFNADGKAVSTRDIAEQHISEDFKGKFIPTVADFFEGMTLQPWMNNAESGLPSSALQVFECKKKQAKASRLKREALTYPGLPSPIAVPLTIPDIKDFKNVTYD